MIEPLSNGIHACRRAGVEPGKTVAILGAGPMGESFCLTAHTMVLMCFTAHTCLTWCGCSPDSLCNQHYLTKHFSMSNVRVRSCCEVTLPPLLQG